MKKRKGFFLLFLMLLVMVFAVPAQAAKTKPSSKRQKAIKAYKKYLQKSNIMIIPKGTKDWQSGKKYKGTKSKNVRFALADVDNDSFPELFICDKNKYNNALFTYYKGKVKRIGIVAEPVGYYNKKNLFVTSGNVELSDFIYQYSSISSSKKIKGVLRYTWYDDYDYYDEDNEDDDDDDLIQYVEKRTSSDGEPYARIREYYIWSKDKNVTKNSFNSNLKKITSGESMTKIILRKNTKTNRRKYLK